MSHDLDAGGLVPDAVFWCRRKIAILNTASTVADEPNQRKNGVFAGRTNKDEATPSKAAKFVMTTLCQSFISTPVYHGLH
jgi:hypothetical protein